jgi:ribose 5-phosphate isomerase B
MKIHIAADHAGFELKEQLKEFLKKHPELTSEVVDHGAFQYEPEDAYPEFCFACAKAVLADPGSLGVVIGGSGNGEQIAANKIHGIRAALAWNLDTARLARQHNNAQILSLGARMTSLEEAQQFLTAFIETPFEGGRHQLRIEQLEDANLIAAAGEK